MHSLSELGASVPAFLAKLWKLVEDPETNELISWSVGGTSFFIRDQAQFSRKLLPMYYKHNNMASFIRQLNMYGFHKIVSADAGSLRLDRDEMEFAHQCFIRGHPYLLEHIKRKVGKSQMLSSKQLEEGREVSSGGVVVKPEFMNKVLNEVKHMRGRQETVETRLTSMKQENEALWRELSLLRQKHLKQQTIVNKLIQFLVTLVQPSQRLSPKRRYPLMINSVAHPNNKTNVKDSSDHTNGNNAPLRFLTLTLPASQSHLTPSPTGPTIHELDSDVILPDTDPELLSNSIILQGPDAEMSDVIDPRAEVLSPEAVVLDSLDAAAMTDPLLINTTTLDHGSTSDVNPCEVEELTVDVLDANSLSPEMLLAVSPADLNPAIVVPALNAKKGASETPAVTTLGSAPLNVSRTTKSSGKAGTRSLVGRKNVSTKSNIPVKNISMKATNIGKNMINNKTVSTGATLGTALETVKKEPRLIPARSRKRKGSGNKTVSMNDTTGPTAAATVLPAASQSSIMKPVDLLAEVGLASPSPIAAEQMSNGAFCGDVAASPLSCSTPSPLVAFPGSVSPVPDIHSPGASPCAPSPPGCLAQPSNTTVTDVTSPLVVFPQSDPGSLYEQSSPQQSPQSAYDLTLACTSQAGSSMTDSTSQSSPQAINRCDSQDLEELGLHIGTLDSELVQLKDLLHNSGISLDANTLLGLFTADDPLSYNMPPGDSDNLHFNLKNEPSGNELAPYHPDFMDLDEIWNDSGRCTPPTPPANIPSELNTPVMTPPTPSFVPSSKKRKL